jgi:hypothetical protein
VNADQIKTSTNAEPKCNHLFSGQEINFEFKRNLRLIAVTLESPTLYACNVALEFGDFFKQKIFIWPKKSDKYGTNYG